MEHNKIKELIEPFVFSELEQKYVVLLKNHLNECAECRAELEDVQMLAAFLNKDKINDVNDKSLYEARRELRAALRVEKNKTSFITGFLRIITGSFTRSYKLVYTGAASLILGLTIGYFIFSSPPHLIVDNSILPEDNFKLRGDVKINNVNFIDNDASDGEVEFTFNAVKPVRMKGKIDDEKIQSILAFSMLNEENPGVRLNSINLISSANQKIVDNEVIDALIITAQYDQNPGVRREALLMLRRLPFDEKIKQTALFILINDDNSALRIEAINCLSGAVKSGYKLDSDERDIFKQKIEHDENSYVRLHAKTVLQGIK
ncbi:MAG: HEAT repeat domain-containing protein [Ignavibacteriaceae bacterium]|nr:HEAT repeat domain-containing protein [Ignavibacteriaceae bacterium]